MKITLLFFLQGYFPSVIFFYIHHVGELGHNDQSYQGHILDVIDDRDTLLKKVSDVDWLMSK